MKKYSVLWIFLVLSLAGIAHSNGSVVAWGSNSVGECVVPEPNEDFVMVSAGGSRSLGLKSDSSISINTVQLFQ